jgi:hypothetical protein
MQEPHKEGVANHLDPESGADGREAVGEASAGAHAGQPLSRTSTFEVGRITKPKNYPLIRGGSLLTGYGRLDHPASE